MNMCLTGTFSLGKQNACTICPEGYECSGSLKKVCAANKWSSKGDGICKFFEGGFSGFKATPYDAGTGIVRRKDCLSGEFSLYGTITCTTCPIGHYCPDDRKDRMPKVCEPGKYQSSPGSTTCDTCGTDTYSLFGAIECHKCPAGYECPSASGDWGFASSFVPKLCPLGYFS